MAASTRRSRLYNSTLSKKHQPLEIRVDMSDLVEGEKYNVTEKTIVKPGVHERRSKAPEIKIITYVGTYYNQHHKAVYFDNVMIDGVKEDHRSVMKEDIVRITRFVFPGLPNELHKRMNGFSKKPSPNRNIYKPIRSPVKLSPGDELIHKDGSLIVVTHRTFVVPGGFYKGNPVDRYRKKTLRGGKHTKKHKSRA